MYKYYVQIENRMTEVSKEVYVAAQREGKFVKLTYKGNGIYFDI